MGYSSRQPVAGGEAGGGGGGGLDSAPSKSARLRRPRRTWGKKRVAAGLRKVPRASLAEVEGRARAAEAERGLGEGNIGAEGREGPRGWLG